MICSTLSCGNKENNSSFDSTEKSNREKTPKIESINSADAMTVNNPMNRQARIEELIGSSFGYPVVFGREFNSFDNPKDWFIKRRVKQKEWIAFSISVNSECNGTGYGAENCINIVVDSVGNIRASDIGLNSSWGELFDENKNSVFRYGQYAGEGDGCVSSSESQNVYIVIPSGKILWHKSQASEVCSVICDIDTGCKGEMFKSFTESFEDDDGKILSKIPKELNFLKPYSRKRRRK